ncbi:MAG: TIGR03435 family protein, partial [Bryobacteraceae bacterium]
MLPIVFFGATRLHCQAQVITVGPPTGPGFEVASVKPSAPLQAGSTSPHVGIKIDGSRVDIGNWSIKQLIVKAYGLDFYQLVAPDWAESARFDVLAKIPDGATQAQVPQMLQQLLLERFRLAVHTETKDLSGFTLVVAKGGPKMKLGVPDPGDTTVSESSTLD